MSIERWSERFSRPDYLFGKSPADFLTRQAALIPEGSRVLCVADGEGRNSVYLAAQGYDVTAFDFARPALDKARALADEAGVQVQTHHSSIEDWDWSQTHDAVVAIFVQFTPPDLRALFFDWMGQAVRPGGLLLLHGYAPRQVGYGTGGPKDEAHMYTQDMLRDAFAGWEVLVSEDYDREIEEGPGHSGRSALIDFVARKPG